MRANLRVAVLAIVALNGTWSVGGLKAAALKYGDEVESEQYEVDGEKPVKSVSLPARGANCDLNPADTSGFVLRSPFKPFRLQVMTSRRGLQR